MWDRNILRLWRRVTRVFGFCRVGPSCQSTIAAFVMRGLRGLLLVIIGTLRRARGLKKRGGRRFSVSLLTRRRSLLGKEPMRPIVSSGTCALIGAPRLTARFWDRSQTLGR